MYQIEMPTQHITIGINDDEKVIRIDWSTMKQIISAKDVKRYLRKAIKFMGK